jgi:hypothetical protein
LAAVDADLFWADIAREDEVDEERTGVGEHFADGGYDIGRLFDSSSGDAHAAGDVDEVERGP